MAMTAKDIMALIEEKGIKMVDFKMVDINGQFRHVTIPASHFSEKTLEEGIGFDASNYGYAVVERATWCSFRIPTPHGWIPSLPSPPSP